MATDMTNSTGMATSNDTSNMADDAIIKAGASHDDDEESPLFRVSAELRNRIYELALTPTKVHVNKDYRLPGLLTTCKQIHHESIKLYYNTSAFHFKSLDLCVEWLTRLPTTYKQLLSAVRLETITEWFREHLPQGHGITNAPGRIHTLPTNYNFLAIVGWHAHDTRQQLEQLVKDMDSEVVKIDQVKTCTGHETPEERAEWLDEDDRYFKRVWVKVKPSQGGDEEWEDYEEEHKVIVKMAKRMGCPCEEAIKRFNRGE